MILTKEYLNNLKEKDNKIYSNVDYCLDYFSNLDLEPDETFWSQYSMKNPYYFHVYWYGEIERKQLLCINSYLATQDLSRTKLIIWIDYQIVHFNNKNKYLDKLQNHRNILIKTYNPFRMSDNTLLEGNDFIIISDSNLIKYRSDIARVLILYHYGGVYFDLDMILFKNLAPFLHLEFCYQWSTINNRGNNGLLSLHKGGNFSKEIMKGFNNYCHKLDH